MKVLLIDGEVISVVPAWASDSDMIYLKPHHAKSNCVLDGRNGKPIKKENIKEMYGINFSLKY